MTNLVHSEVITAEVLVKYFTRTNSNRLDVPLSAPVEFRLPLEASQPPKSPDHRRE